MISTTEALAAAGVACTGLAVAAAAFLQAGREHRATPAPLTAPPAPDAYLPCHNPVCGHMSTPHDRTTAGLTCLGCGALTLAAEPTKGDR